jgi:hypothetical protein
MIICCEIYFIAFYFVTNTDVIIYNVKTILK